MQPADPSHYRVSDDDRHRVADLLRDAAGEGRLDLDELDERLEAAYAAKVYADLVPLTADLPAAGGVAPVTVPGMHGVVQTSATAASAMPAAVHSTSWAALSETSRKGLWDVPTTHTATAVMGSVVLDLREARFTSPVTVITATAVMGEVSIYVNAGTQVIVDGTGIMGEFSQARDRVQADIGPGAPVVRVKGVALMGAVTVTRKRMPGEPGKLKKWLNG
ncbi:DUF1707 SHOCT-like domain-containing protein [Nocardioides yefusunii]|uniref:DUF1707 domain-containing protein n=1 Tax=Nocardioides yefusunii TaxID=2500546 RepID=A0ABW1QWG4_9ACTN|nr:DUF1707 domain-containing protein [Nocardioides yefusunii]